MPIPPTDMPGPDIVVTRFEASGRAPVPVETVALVVEVADTTARYDLGPKARLYASAGVPEYWAADISAGLLHQFWAPHGESYSGRSEQPLDARVEAATLPLALDLAGLAG